MTSSSRSQNERVVAKKLHKQFAHPTPERLLKLVKHSSYYSKKLEEEIKNISKQCETCLKFKKAPPRPVVSLPMATNFNDAVAIDLKAFEGQYFLVIVDMATRFCSAAVIKNKLPSTIVKNMFTSWITTFGAPKKILSDNGCEFNNVLFREFGEGFNIKILTTAAESPFSNGICERLNGVLGNLVNKILHESRCDIEMALAWAVSARNALDNNAGYSPNQLVFGYNPAIPDIFHNELPGLETASKSEILRKNLNALHIARSEFIKFESDERISRALRHNIRETDLKDLNTGDEIFYKRNSSDQWHGPAKVIGTDGKQIMVRHGGYPLRVHITRLARQPRREEPTENGASIEPAVLDYRPINHETRPLCIDSNKKSSNDTEGSATGTTKDEPVKHNSEGRMRSKEKNSSLGTHSPNTCVPLSNPKIKNSMGHLFDEGPHDKSGHGLHKVHLPGPHDKSGHGLQGGSWSEPHDKSGHGLNIEDLPGPHDKSGHGLQVEGWSKPHDKSGHGLDIEHLPGPHDNPGHGLQVESLPRPHDNPGHGLQVENIEHLPGLHDNSGHGLQVEPLPGPHDNPGHGLQVESWSKTHDIEGHGLPVEEDVGKLENWKTGQRFRGINTDTGKIISGRIIGRAGKVKGKNKSCYNIKEDETGWIGWYDLGKLSNLTRINENSEMIVLFTNAEVAEAQEKELETWIENDVFEEIEDRGQRTISVRWIITEKTKNDQIVTKARLVARGFEENTDDLQKDSPTCSRRAIRMLIAIAASKNWNCHTVDVKSAYLQGDKINREVFLRPPPEFNNGKLWRLKKTVYGLSDAARAWYDRLMKELKSLKVTMCGVEPSLYFWHHNKKLEGMLAIYVDDFLWAGTKEFKEHIIDRLKQKFLIGSSGSKSFTYLGLRINSFQDGISVDQSEYIASLQNIPVSSARASQKSSKLSEKEVSEYRSLVGQLNWIATQTRPDIAFDVCDLSMAAQSATVENLKKLNKVLRWTKEEHLKLGFPKLTSISNCTLECYTDAAFGNLPGGFSQGGYIIFLKDNLDNTCPISWQSRKIKRAVNEIMAAETLALVAGAEAAVNIAYSLRQITGQKDKVKINCYVDSKNVQSAVYSSHQVDNMRLRIDMKTIKNMIEREEVHEVIWVSTENQIADVLTKRGVNKAKIRASVDRLT